jgi:nucleotide-binding universal stress UspA family protein
MRQAGVKAKVHSVKDGQTDIGSVLLDQASSLGSQMIIMGAYGHSRIRELMPGGATRHILEHVQLPVLFSY